GRSPAEESIMSQPSTKVIVLEAPPRPRPEAAPARARVSVLAVLARVLPTLLVLACLGGLAYWGYHTGWTVPRFSALFGDGGEEKDDWCKAHSIPESECVECNAGLLPRPPKYGWCDAHKVHDCPLDHPDVAQLQSTGGIPLDELKTQARTALE